MHGCRWPLRDERVFFMQPYSLGRAVVSIKGLWAMSWGRRLQGLSPLIPSQDVESVDRETLSRPVHHSTLCVGSVMPRGSTVLG